MDNPLTPLVVQYPYVHEREEGFYYPTARAGSSSTGVAIRYLECALTQAASLRLRELDCELALATNVRDRGVLCLLRRLQDDGWIMAQHLRSRAPGFGGAS